MTNLEIIEQLENTIGLIKQDGKDWLDDRDVPILEACVKALTALDKIRAEIEKLQKSCDVAQDMFKESQEMVYCYKAFKQAYTKVIGIIDRYRNEVSE